MHELLGPAQVRAVLEMLTSDPLRPGYPLAIEVTPLEVDRAFNAIIHRSAGSLHLELDPLRPSEQSAAAHFLSIRAAVLRIQDATSPEDACCRTAQQVARLREIDRLATCALCFAARKKRPLIDHDLMARAIDADPASPST